MRKDSFNLRKKDFPGLVRVTQDGQRVWQYKGKMFLTKREVYFFQNPPKVKAAEVAENKEKNAANEWGDDPESEVPGNPA